MTDKPSDKVEVVHVVGRADFSRNWFAHPDAELICGRTDGRVCLSSGAYFQTWEEGRQVLVKTSYVEVEGEEQDGRWVEQKTVVLETEGEMRKRLKKEERVHGSTG